jgi:DNA adenine methylase
LICPSPFVKWAGGKAQLLAQYEPYFPTSFGRYIEPFVGGGAVFFHLHNQGRLDARPGMSQAGQVTLADSLDELVNAYRVVQGQVGDLIAALQAHEPRKGEPDYYYELRGWDRRPDFSLRSPVERAARFIFLNRVCYNGLYRVNSKGQFNVPFGRHTNPNVCDADNLRAVHWVLQGVELRVGDFEQCLEIAASGDFVYLDPPYHPLSETANFTSYTPAAFGLEEQKRLAHVFDQLDRRGCKVMLSNSDTSLIREMYRGHDLVPVQAIRSISRDGRGRGSVAELLVLNSYDKQ